MQRSYHEFFTDTSVLEIGSRNVNGTVRDLFMHTKRYIGVDCTPGPCVDVVCLAHEYHSDELFDVVISCEAFEHDPYLELTLANCLLLLRPGGLFVATAAGPRRAEHGTKHHDGPGDFFGPDPHYYKNLDPSWLRNYLDGYLDSLTVVEWAGGNDVYAHGLRKQTIGYGLRLGKVGTNSRVLTPLRVSSCVGQRRQDD